MSAWKLWLFFAMTRCLAQRLATFTAKIGPPKKQQIKKPLSHKGEVGEAEFLRWVANEEISKPLLRERICDYFDMEIPPLFSWNHHPPKRCEFPPPCRPNSAPVKTAFFAMEQQPLVEEDTDEFPSWLGWVKWWVNDKLSSHFQLWN